MKLFNSFLAFVLFISVAVAESTFPFIGEVQVGNSLNVRSKPSVESGILGRLKNKDRVIVIGEDQGYYKLQYPKQLKSWMAGSLLLNNGGKATDVVARNQVNVRSGPSLQYSVIAELKKGTQVKVLEKNNKDWVRITPPETAVAWVSKKYIVAGESIAEFQKKEQKRSEAAALLASAKKEFTLYLKRKTISEAEYLTLKDKFAKAQSMTNDDMTKLAIQNHILKLSEFRSLNKIREVKLAEEERFKAKQAQLEKQYQSEIEEIKKKDDKVKRKFEYEGFIDDIGGILFRPATHKLKKGNKVVFYLKSSTIDLDQYSDKRVGVDGEIKRHKIWGRIMDVKEIEVLYDPPSQFWTEEEQQ